MSGIGLGKEYWKEVTGVLREIIPVYDKVNRAISLGNDTEFRLEGIRLRVFPGNLVLDAGSGFGNMSQLVLQEIKGHANIVMYDPIVEMLHNVRRFGLKNSESYYDRISMATGVFEYIPFKSDIFDAVICGYSLRDAIQLGPAIAEIHRVLKKEGRLIIVDIGKSNHPLIKAFSSFYLKYILSIIAFIIAGKEGFKFRTIHGTFLKWPENQVLYKMLANNFRRVEFKERMMGAAIIVAAYK
jgi:demethylmenaquinone methyltransferase / 2-methoxy-6-polyprenyl-1,4-benzoquinol methylase